MFIFRWIKGVLGFIRDYFKSFLLIFFVIWLFSPDEQHLQNYNLAKVYLKGEIMIVDEIVEELRDIYEDDSVKGMLLVVDSGGGAMDKSIEISDIVKKIAEKKPVVTYASGTIASGSYYASIWSHEIMANRGSIVGSIGVIFDGINYKELMDKIGLYPQTMKAGKYKEAGTGAREWLPYEKEEIESLINTSYDMFVTDVATARGLDINHSTEFADAHIFKASKAMEVGLIDSTGTIIDAEKRVEELAGVHKPVWEKESEMEKLMASLSTKIFGEISSSFDWKMR